MNARYVVTTVHASHSNFPSNYAFRPDVTHDEFEDRAQAIRLCTRLRSALNVVVTLWHLVGEETNEAHYELLELHHAGIH